MSFANPRERKDDMAVSGATDHQYGTIDANTARLPFEFDLDGCLWHRITDAPLKRLCVMDRSGTEARDRLLSRLQSQGPERPFALCKRKYPSRVHRIQSKTHP